jgi:Domain of unknown function (DUF5667)
MSDMLPRPEPREPFKRALRSQLMAQASTALVRRETVWSRFQHGLMRPALAFAAVILVLVGGAGKAAADSVAGDLTFGLKTAAERLQLAFAFDDTTRLVLLSDDADHRLAELSRALTTRPEAAPTATDEYAAAVARFTAAVDALRGKPGASADKRTAAEDVVDAAHLKHEAVLDELKRSAPESAQGGVERAKLEADKLHASDQPARTPEPSDRVDPTRSPQPTRTAPPARTTEPARSSDPARTSEPPRATETPRSEPTRTAPRPSPTRP